MEMIQQIIKNAFEDRSAITSMPDFIQKRKISSQAFFEKNGFPSRQEEAWRSTDYSAFLNQELEVCKGNKLNEQYQFQCNVPNLQVNRISLLNGFFAPEEKGLIQKMENGILAGSLKQAIKEFPDLIEKYFGECTHQPMNGFYALNTRLFEDGFFIYIPDGVEVEEPIQMLDVIKSSSKLLLNSRNLIFLGKNSRLKLIHCDDSYNSQSSFSNIVTEMYLDEGAYLEHYKMQNLNNESALVSLSYLHLEKDACILSNGVHLNAGLVRNQVEVYFNNTGGEADISGLSLVDKSQHIDHHVFVDHASENCYSSELFKNIIDDAGSVVFNGHILVEKKGAGTNAFQSSKSLLLSDKAKVNSKPFLEIYNENVKCSHGATVGQLDNNALFYLKSRGIGEQSAKMLLMYAFCDEVVKKINIEALRERLNDMVKKRLHGELSICEHCALDCSSHENKYQLFSNNKEN